MMMSFSPRDEFISHSSFPSSFSESSTSPDSSVDMEICYIGSETPSDPYAPTPMETSGNCYFPTEELHEAPVSPNPIDFEPLEVGSGDLSWDYPSSPRSSISLGSSTSSTTLFNRSPETEQPTSPAIAPFTQSELVALLRPHSNNSQVPIILDIRTLGQFTQSRIRGSIHVNLPTTLLRRNSVGLDQLLSTLRPHNAILNNTLEWILHLRSHSHIVLYDHQSTDAPETSNISLLFNKILAEIRREPETPSLKSNFEPQIMFLVGGFSKFSKNFPEFVEIGKDRSNQKPIFSGKLDVEIVLPSLGQSSHYSGCNPFDMKTEPRISVNLRTSPSIHKSDSSMKPVKKISGLFERRMQSNKDILSLTNITEFSIKKTNESTFFPSNMSSDFSKAYRTDVDTPPEYLQMDILRTPTIKSKIPYGTPMFLRQIISSDTIQILMNKFKIIENDEKTRLHLGFSAKKKTDPYSLSVGLEMLNLFEITVNENRVVLPTSSMSGCDYINASFIRDPLNPPKQHKNRRLSSSYIATQAPTPSTFQDFWRMCWDQNSRDDERGKHSHRYWPTCSSTTMSFQDFNINLITEQLALNDLVCLRIFEMVQANERRKILHIQFSHWPDHGVPTDVDSFIKLRYFVRDARQLIENKNSDFEDGPVVIHCSAGCGRTGTFITLDSVFSLLTLQKGPSDTYFEPEDDVIFKSVKGLRCQRILMVQSLSQFIFCYEGLYRWVSAMAGSSARGEVRKSLEDVVDTREVQKVLQCCTKVNRSGGKGQPIDVHSEMSHHPSHNLGFCYLSCKPVPVYTCSAWSLPLARLFSFDWPCRVIPFCLTFSELALKFCSSSLQSTSTFPKKIATMTAEAANVSERISVLMSIPVLLSQPHIPTDLTMPTTPLTSGSEIPDYLSAMAVAIEEEDIQKGHTIIREGATDPFVFVIAKGEAEVYKGAVKTETDDEDGFSSSATDHGDVKLLSLRRGDFLGLGTM
ncbi:hypothetical protein HK096_002375, partial [Nowakowskiella sp. JEL0078]